MKTRIRGRIVVIVLGCAVAGCNREGPAEGTSKSLSPVQPPMSDTIAIQNIRDPVKVRAMLDTYPKTVMVSRPKPSWSAMIVEWARRALAWLADLSSCRQRPEGSAI